MRRLIPGLLMLGLLATACGDDTPTPPTTPNPPTTPPITEPLFTGTLRTNGAATYPFTATAGGTITATLTTLAPNSLGIGLSIGTWTGSACQVVIANDNAVQAAVVTGTVTAAANLCVRVYDAGRLTAPADFTVTIVHP
jgi:hypothetical protein